jgi:hypothetical protein
MRRLKFDYVKIGRYKRPIIPVRLTYLGNSVNTTALIDSGADFNIFPLSLAKDIGLNLNFNKSVVFRGVGENSPKLTGYMGILDVVIYNKGEAVKFSSPILFTEDIPSNGISLLGEFGFFDHLEKVSLLYKRGKILLEN